MVVIVATMVAVLRPSTPAASTGEPFVDTADREVVAAAYSAAFEAPIPALDWEGDHEECHPGTSSVEYRRSTIARVNYYRAMAGVPATVSEEPTFSVKAQNAAMMMSVEGELTHSPSPTFACFNAVGQEAAANSNLYLGRTGPWAVDGYIEDPGEGNVDVGHRNTILHPPTKLMGVGDVDSSADGYSANALWVFDDGVFDESPTSENLVAMREERRFVAWPPRGYVPATLVHPRWSFTKAGVDLSEAEVTLHRLNSKGDWVEVPLTVVNRSGAPGHVPLPSLVWEPEIELESDRDTDYLVVIGGVTVAATPGVIPMRADAPLVFSYTVRVMGEQPSTELTVAEFLVRLGQDGSS